MPGLLEEVVSAQKQGESRGIASICSAHPWVLRRALRGGGPVLIEATCNQVNQEGGYTGMTPADFALFARELAREAGGDPERLLLGGDHLGPLPWAGRPGEEAMAKASTLVQACVRAGFGKIHLDASMPLGGDHPGRPMDPELAARRAALLARAAEEAADPASPPRYVIGTEVPAAGGAAGEGNEGRVTEVPAARDSLEATRREFLRLGLGAAWERVRALVVQPGVEFGDEFVREYDPRAARDLARFIEATPLVFEAHSTDYQGEESLRALVRDHFAILKVGPALTFAFRQAAFALAGMEAELVPAEGERSGLVERLEQAMTARPEHWRRYYTGTPAEQGHKRLFSRSDRLRYYWAEPEVQQALLRLLANLGEGPLPGSLVERFLPGAGGERTPREILLWQVGKMLEGYARACGGGIRTRGSNGFE